MVEWIFTGVFLVVLAAVIRTEIRCGRRTKDFLVTIGPEIEDLNRRAVAKYRARFGQDPYPGAAPPHHHPKEA